MSKWWHISTNSEILIMTLIGLTTTIVEGIYMNLRENIKEVWMLKFPEEICSTGLEHLVKTILSGIVVVRGATVHAALASYLLIIYPVITERMRIMLVVWMVIAAIRSVLINIIATCTGSVLCAAYPDIRPVCFEFAITKAIELAFTVFMWVNVNDFYHLLKGKQRNVAANTDTAVSTQSTLFHLRKKDDLEGSFDSYSMSLSQSFLNRIKDSSFSEENSKDMSSINSSMAKTTVEWFMKKAIGIQLEQGSIIDDTKAIELFLSMSVDDIVQLQQKMKKFLEKNVSREGKVIYHDENKISNPPLQNVGNMNRQEEDAVSNIKNSETVTSEKVINIMKNDSKSNRNVIYIENVEKQSVSKIEETASQLYSNEHSKLGNKKLDSSLTKSLNKTSDVSVILCRKSRESLYSQNIINNIVASESIQAINKIIVSPEIPGALRIEELNSVSNKDALQMDAECSSTNFKNKIANPESQDNELISISDSNESIVEDHRCDNESCEFCGKGKEFVELDETTIVRAIYERKSAAATETRKASKKVIWKIKKGE